MALDGHKQSSSSQLFCCPCHEICRATRLRIRGHDLVFYWRMITSHKLSVQESPDSFNMTSNESNCLWHVRPGTALLCAVGLVAVTVSPWPGPSWDWGQTRPRAHRAVQTRVLECAARDGLFDFFLLSAVALRPCVRGYWGMGAEMWWDVLGNSEVGKSWSLWCLCGLI